MYVKNLPDNMDDEGLVKLFAPYGKIRSAKAITRELYQSYLGIRRSVKVFGYICFEDRAAAKEAKDDLNQKNVFPNLPKLFVDYHQSKAERNEFIKLQMIQSSYKNFQKHGQPTEPRMGGNPQVRESNFTSLKLVGRMPGGVFGSHMLRKFPPQMAMPHQGGFPNGFPNNHGPNFMYQQYAQPEQIDVSMMDPHQKREFFGEKLYMNISSNPIYSHDSE